MSYIFCPEVWFALILWFADVASKHALSFFERFMLFKFANSSTALSYIAMEVSFSLLMKFPLDGLLKGT